MMAAERERAVDGSLGVSLCSRPTPCAPATGGTASSSCSWSWRTPTPPSTSPPPATAAHGAAAVDARDDEALDDEALAQSSIRFPSSRRPRAAALPRHCRLRGGGSFGHCVTAMLAALAPAGTDCDVIMLRVRGVFKVGARVMILFFGAVV